MPRPSPLPPFLILSPQGTLCLPFCATTRAFEAVLPLLHHACVIVCVSTTTFLIATIKYLLQTLQGVSFVVWGAQWPCESKNAHVIKDPGSDSLSAMCPARDSHHFTEEHAVVWHSYVGFPKVMHQSAAGLWHPYTALLFVIHIFCAVIMPENGCSFLNRRKVAARISRIKARLAGNQCRVLEMGKVAEPRIALCISREQHFSSLKQRLLLQHRGKWTCQSPLPPSPWAVVENLTHALVLDCLSQKDMAEPGWPWWLQPCVLFSCPYYGFVISASSTPNTQSPLPWLAFIWPFWNLWT